MEYKKDLTVLASSTDYSAGVGLVGAICYLQDNMCDMFKMLGADGLTMIPKCNAFFVITKTKIKFHNFPKWLDEITLKTSVVDVSKIRVNLSNNVCDRIGEICIEGIQELCAIDKDSRKLRSVDSTLFPVNIDKISKTSDMNFDKLNYDKDDFKFVKSITVDMSNVDFYMHTNNVEYVKFCVGAIGENLINKTVDTFEIHYVKESVVGDTLDIYIKESDNEICVLILCEDEVVVKSKVVFNDK